MDTIASRLKYARELRGISQTDLARLAKISQSTIGNIEAGTRDGLVSLPVIADALNVRYDWLRSGEEPMSKPTLDWPFEGITSDRFAGLTERQKGEVERAMREVIEAIEARAGNHKKA